MMSKLLCTLLPLAAGQIAGSGGPSKDLTIVPPATAKHDTESSIGRVVGLLKKMQEDIAADNDRDGRMYDQFACFCKEESASRGTDIEASKLRLVELTKSINTASSLIEEANLQIKFRKAQMAKENAKQKKLTAMMKRDDTDYAQRKSEFTETMNVLGKAVKALTSKKRSFLEAETEIPKMFGLIQQLTGKSVNAGNMGMATGYLVDLKKQTAVDLQTDTAANLKARTVYNEEMLLSMQAIAQHDFIKASQEKIRGVNMKKKGEDVEEYNATKEKMDTDVEYFKNLQKDCDARSKFYNQQLLDANAEVAAIESALPILQSIVDGTQQPPAMGDSSDSPSSFLQVSATLSGRVTKVSKCIAKMTRSNKATVLEMLETAEGSSAVAKLVKTCETMITDLEAGIQEVEQHKAQCQSETARLANELQLATRAKDKTQHLVDLSKSEVEHLSGVIEHLEGELATNEEAQHNLAAQCAATHTTLQAQATELRSEHAAIGQAIDALAAAYGGEAVAALKKHEHFKEDYNDKHDTLASKQSTENQDTDFTDQNKRRSGGAAIVSMLQMIADDVDKNIKDTDAELAESKEACKTQQTELEDLWGELDTLKVENVGKKDDRNAQLGKEVIGLGEKTTAEGQAQRAVSEYGNCAQKIQEYNNAISAKRADIEGLNTVINFLQTVPDGAESAIGF